MKIVVLDGFAADQGELSWSALSRHGALEVHARSSRAELVGRAAGAAVILTNKVLVDEAAIAGLPDLRYVGIVATGTNAVDLAACRARGIAVTNVPGYSAPSVAQHVFALVLHFTNDVAAHDDAVKAGAWSSSPDFMFCLRPLTELAGKTLGVVGLGAIGRAVAEIGRAFGMRVIALAVPGSPTTGGRTPLAAGLPLCDVVTLHCPLTPATHRLVGAGFLAAMKARAVLVNTSRGALIDEAALALALDSGRLSGVGLDVVEREPPPAAARLLSPSEAWSRRVVVTPHLGWATTEARARLIAEVAENVGAFCRGEARNRVEGEPAPQTLSLPPSGAQG